MFASRFNSSRPMIPNLVVAQRVLDKMAAAAARYIADETGEAMVGLLVPGTYTGGVPTLYVLDTIAPDESAVRQLHTFQQGDERQDELIWWLQENWRAGREKHLLPDGQPLAARWDVPLRYLGDWHKQPGFMIQPSQGDLMTAMGWIADEANNMDFLLAPIVTLGHPGSASNTPPGANYVTVPQNDDTCMRVDFWYLDSASRDFHPIAPAVYPDAQLPSLPAYPWHLVNEARFQAEYSLLEKDGLFTSLVLWSADGSLPLSVCLLAFRVGWNRAIILITPWNYPAARPTARVAPLASFDSTDDIFSMFETLWAQSEPVADPPGWTWTDGRHLIDYLYALEAALDLRKPEADTAGDTEPPASTPSSEESLL